VHIREYLRILRNILKPIRRYRKIQKNLHY